MKKINIKTAKIIIFIIQIIAMFAGFIYACKPDSNGGDTTKNFQYINHYLDWTKQVFIFKVCVHNYTLSILQACLSFFSFGVLGVLFLFNDFYIYGLVFKYIDSGFLFLASEILGTIISILFSTHLCFEVAAGKINLKRCAQELFYCLLINFMIFFIAAQLEANIIFE